MRRTPSQHSGRLVFSLCRLGLDSVVLLTGAAFILSPPLTAAQMPVQEWVRRYSGPGDDYPVAVAIDPEGNVVVSGYSRGSGTGFDYTTIKYSGAGVPLWTNRYDGPANATDVPHGLAVDSQGNVFVTGYSLDPGVNKDYATVAYSSGGVALWTNRYNGPGNRVDEAYAVAVDAGGNVYVTGTSDGGTSRFDYTTIAYSGTGQPLWTNRYNGPGNGGDGAASLAVDASSNVIVTGSSYGSNYQSDYATIKYSSAGIPLWTNRYGPGGASAVAVDSAGNIYATGTASGAGSGTDYVTIKYAANGVPLWTNRYDGPGHTNDYPYALAVDASGNVYVTGLVSRRGNTWSSNYGIVAYSTAGVELWTNLYTEWADQDEAYAIAVDRRGNVIVTGQSWGEGTGTDWATIKYSSAGIPLWTNRYNGPSNSLEVARAIAVDAVGNVFVTGESSNGVDYDYVTIKYSVPSPALAIQRLKHQIVLSWADSSFNLQAAPSATRTFTNVLGATSPWTNAIIGDQQYFRLIGSTFVQ